MAIYFENLKKFEEHIYLTSEINRNNYWEVAKEPVTEKSVPIQSIKDTYHARYASHWVNGVFQCISGNFPGSREPVDASGVQTGWKPRSDNDSIISLYKNPIRDEYIINGGNNRIMFSLRSGLKDLFIYAEILTCHLKPNLKKVIEDSKDKKIVKIKLEALGSDNFEVNVIYKERRFCLFYCVKNKSYVF